MDRVHKDSRLFLLSPLPDGDGQTHHNEYTANDVHDVQRMKQRLEARHSYLLASLVAMKIADPVETFCPQVMKYSTLSPFLHTGLPDGGVRHIFARQAGLTDEKEHG